MGVHGSLQPWTRGDRNGGFPRLLVGCDPLVLATLSASSIRYSYLSLPLGAVLATIWAVSAFVVLLLGRREDGGPGTTPAISPARSFLRGATIAILFALSPIAITYTAGFIASGIGCDLNEVAEHPCTILGVNVGPLLATMAQSIWFISLTVMAGLLALVVLLIVFIVRTVKARRAKVDATGAKA